MPAQPLITLPEPLVKPQRIEYARHLLAVDGGGTKTLAALFDAEEERLWIGRAGPSNADNVGASRAAQAIVAAAEVALTEAGVAWGEPAASVAALAGTDTEAAARSLADASPGSWIVVNDVVAAWAAATAVEPGIAVIAGTGSNVFGVGEHSRCWRAGGWGHLLGDEGSGFWIAREAIAAALRGRDGSGEPSVLERAACDFFDYDSIEHLASAVYSRPILPSELASFTGEVDRLAVAGDEFCRDIFARGAAELARRVAAVIEHTGLAGRFPVGLLGGAFRAGDLLVEPLRAAIAELAPEAETERSRLEPIGGSLMLAAHACGARVDGERLAALIDAQLTPV